MLGATEGGGRRTTQDGSGELRAESKIRILALRQLNVWIWLIHIDVIAQGSSTLPESTRN